MTEEREKKRVSEREREGRDGGREGGREGGRDGRERKGGGRGYVRKQEKSYGYCDT
jgi:hypothetical protein